MYYIVLSLVCACVLLWSFLFFFLVRDPFILAHAIGALLYLCIHWSVQHKKIYIQKFSLWSIQKKVVFVRKKREVVFVRLELTTFTLARCSTTRKRPPPVYHGGPKANKQAFNSAQTCTMWGSLRCTPITKFTLGLRFYRISSEARQAWCTVQLDGP